MYPLNYVLHVGVMLTIIEVFIILFLLCLWQFWKQVSKLPFQMSVQIYFFLGQTEGGEEDLFWKVQEGEPHCEITTKCTWLS